MATRSTDSLATPAGQGSGAGSYPIAITLGNNPNYAVTPLNATLTVTPGSLIVTANDATKLLGAPLPAFTTTFGGFIDGDSAASLVGTLTFATAANASSPVGTYPVMPGGVTSPNYDISFMAGTLTIRKHPPALRCNEGACARRRRSDRLETL